MATDSAETGDEGGEGDDETTYDRFERRVTKISNVGDASGVLGWDQQVMMPEGGTPARSKQLSTLSSIQHDLLTADETGALLDKLEDADLTAEQAAVVREVRREYERETRVPVDLVERIAEASSEAHPTWKDAKADSDFDAFAPALEELLDLKVQYAEHVDPDRQPYEVLFEDYEPYLGLETAERILERLADELPDIIDAVRDSDADPPSPFEGEFDPGTQEDLARDALDTLGYDWDRGRLDTAPHPFSTGTQFDARVTTRFDPEDALGALTSTIHEFGHASYTLGLPDEHYGTPLGDSRDMTVHESQSRFWENHVGRTEPFWDLFLPSVTERFPDVSATPREAYEAANRIRPDNLIRVEADELTYHLHIVIRFEIERALVAGDLDVEEVPAVWNDKYEEYLGVRPENDAEGCLQDIHWSYGSFGYFPTYSLGSVLAAQLDAALREDVADVDGKIRSGEFDPIHDWMTEKVHRHGCRYPTDELIRNATGEDLTADYYLDYAREKFGDIYGVDL